MKRRTTRANARAKRKRDRADQKKSGEPFAGGSAYAMKQALRPDEYLLRMADLREKRSR